VREQVVGVQVCGVGIGPYIKPPFVVYKSHCVQREEDASSKSRAAVW